MPDTAQPLAEPAADSMMFDPMSVLSPAGVDAMADSEAYPEAIPRAGEDLDVALGLAAAACAPGPIDELQPREVRSGLGDVIPELFDLNPVRGDVGSASGHGIETELDVARRDVATTAL